MVQKENITAMKNLTDHVTCVTIDVTELKEALSVPKQSRILEKTQFEIDCENRTSIEESRKRMHAKIDSLWPV